MSGTKGVLSSWNTMATMSFPMCLFRWSCNAKDGRHWPCGSWARECPLPLVYPRRRHPCKNPTPVLLEDLNATVSWDQGPSDLSHSKACNTHLLPMNFNQAESSYIVMLMKMGGLQWLHKKCIAAVSDSMWCLWEKIFIFRAWLLIALWLFVTISG